MADEEKKLFACPKCGGTTFEAANIQTIRERCFVTIDAEDFSFDVENSWDEEIQECEWETQAVKCADCETVTDLGPYILGDVDGMDKDTIEKGGAYGPEPERGE